ncbi:flavin reductase family protein [Saccharopolyspora griseoalba]|uniref:Flavin reductase family protein n=1 Tax=Saccharopolyspora griseoalba TaxID=1431848 RepID=A0ABW2LU69_9PSEU
MTDEHRAGRVVRDLIDPSPDHVRAITAISLGPEECLARLVTPLLTEISSDFASLEGPTAARVVRTAMELISALLRTAALARTTEGDREHLSLMPRIRQHITDDLGDSELSPDSTARRLHLHPAPARAVPPAGHHGLGVDPRAAHRGEPPRAGRPRLARPASWYECTPWAEHDGGDHTLFLGRVEHFGHRRGDCLAFVDGGFVTIPESR